MIKRHITSIIKDSLEQFPAVLIHGARQVGKSTIAEQLVSEGTLEQYVLFDDLVHLEAALHDPQGFLSQYEAISVALDELQRVPDLLLVLKRSIDANRKSGRFLLTGSARILSHPEVADSLAGRLDIVTLEGLSLGEIHQQNQAPSFVEDLFSGVGVQALAKKWHKKLAQNRPGIALSELHKRVLMGGFPEVVLKDNLRFRERWYNAYLTAYLEKDLRDLNQGLDILLFGKFLRVAAHHTGQLLNIKSMASDIGIDQRTVARYFEMLEITFQANRLTPWFANLKKRMVKTPKLYLNDSGIACFFAGVNQIEELERSPMYGALVETWVWSEIRKLKSLTIGIQTGFYRTHLGKEVDFVLAKGDVTWGLEFKCSNTVTRKDFAGLIDMQSALPKSKGILLYTGDKMVSFSETLLAVPLNVLSV